MDAGSSNGTARLDIATSAVGIPTCSMLHAKLVTMAFFWGGTFIAGKVLANTLPFYIAGFGRFFIAVLLLLIIVSRAEGGLPRLNRSQLMTTAAMGFTGIFMYNVCFLGALSRIPAGRTALFVSLTPIVTALAARAIFRERLGAIRWLGVVIAFLGALIVISRGDPVRAVLGKHRISVKRSERFFCHMV